MFVWYDFRCILLCAVCIKSNTVKPFSSKLLGFNTICRPFDMVSGEFLWILCVVCKKSNTVMDICVIYNESDGSREFPPFQSEFLSIWCDFSSISYDSRCIFLDIMRRLYKIKHGNEYWRRLSWFRRISKNSGHSLQNYCVLIRFLVRLIRFLVYFLEHYVSFV